MGLDQYAYAAAKAEQQESQEIAYWRKHSSLQGWMANLYAEKYPNQELEYGFNGVELELTWDDLDRLERDVLSGNLPKTSGFFFGEGADDYYRDTDLEFIKAAKTEVFMGLKVFYNSSW